MMPTLATLLKTVAGKVVIGLTVVTMGVGAAAATGADVPVLMTAEAPDEDSSEEESSEEESSEEESSEEESSEEESSEEESREESIEKASAEEEPGEDEPGEGPNHGTIVSEFTQGIDLTGCEKGQATAAVARGDVDPTALDDAELSEALDPFIAKCDRGDDGDDSDEDADEDNDEDSDDEGADAEWKALRDEEKAAWHDAKSVWEEQCGDDEAEGSGDGDGDGDDDDGMSAECRAGKTELKQQHKDGKDNWKAARDEAKAERKSSKGSPGNAKGHKKNG